MSLPPLPTLDGGLLDAYVAAHAQVTEEFEATAPDVRLVFMHLQRRLIMEGLAYVQSVSVRPDSQLLLPPPRAFLTRTQQLRMRGAAAGFRHIDTRITLERRGDVPAAIHPSTPHALHALFEGMNPGDHETNPGMYRATSTSWQKDINPFQHPHHSDVPALVDEVLEQVADRSLPGPVRAAWLTFTMLSIHPFVDGNGRTCRSLYLLVASPELPLGLDWGILDQWSVSRSTYIATLQAGNRIREYDAARMTAEPFAAYSTAASIRGAEVCVQRLGELARRYDARRALGMSGDAATIAGVIEVQRCCTWDELTATGMDFERIDAAVAELLDRRVAAWTPRPAGRITVDDTARFALALTA